MNIDRLFPDQFRAFVNGPLSICVGRFGGIDSVERLDIRDFHGKLYPDRIPIPWITRNVSKIMERPLYGPGIRFLSENVQYVPEKPELHPFGFRSDAMSMILKQNSAAFRFAGHKTGTFRIVFCRHHMPDGKRKSLQNQLARNDTGIRWLPGELRGPGFNPELPFPENGVVIDRAEPVFDPVSGMFVFRIECTYADRKKSLAMAIAISYGSISSVATEAFDRVPMFSVLPDGWVLSANVPEKEPVFVGFGFAPSEEESWQIAQNAAETFETQFAEELCACEPMLNVRIGGLPESSVFFREMPGYQRHLLLAETNRELAIRAATSKFGFFALWDDIYPSRDFLLFGEPERTQKMLRYMLGYPWVETCPWITMQLTLAIGEYLAFTRDDAFSDEALPHLRRFLDFSERFTDPVTGLLKTSLNCGVDNAKEAGLDDLFFASCLNGWWYDSLRTLENLAFDHDDTALVERCSHFAENIDAHYTDAFFDGREGYLRAALRADETLPAVAVFQNTHTIAMDYPYGRHLFRNILPKLAAWQAERLRNPMGHTAVPWDSAVPCEMWKSVHMNQHLGHECRVARCGGRPDEALRVMKGYLEYFTKYRCAIETFNLAGCDGDSHQTSDWQAFSATGAAQGLLRGVGGLDWHRGGLLWNPAEESTEFSVENLHFLGCRCSIHASGRGKYVKSLTVNGCRIIGSLQIPDDVFPRSGDARIEIKRSSRAPEYPVLLSAPDCPVTEVSVQRNVLSFQIGKTVRTPLRIASESPIIVLRNGIPLNTLPDSIPGILWCDALFHTGDRIAVLLYADSTCPPSRSSSGK